MKNKPYDKDQLHELQSNKVASAIGAKRAENLRDEMLNAKH